MCDQYNTEVNESLVDCVAQYAVLTLIIHKSQGYTQTQHLQKIQFFGTDGVFYAVCW